MARQPVGVDVTAHKERRAAADARRSAKLRARFYVELVVGSRHASHARVGFSGTFKALLALHKEFERALSERFQAQTQAHQSRASASSSSSSSSSSGSGVRRFFKQIVKKSASDRGSLDQGDHRLSYSSNGGGGMPQFPANNKLLVRIEGDAGKDDAKVEARAAALFEYYTQLFNSEDGDLFLDLVYQHAALAAEKKRKALAEPKPEDAEQTRGFFKHLMARHDKDGALEPSSTAVEFLEPVHVHKTKAHKSAKRGSNQRHH